MVLIDHLVVTTPRLSEGVEYIQDLCGVLMSPGGKHERMGTYNRLLRIGESSYLEVIAVDPDAKAPSHPRWFGLDELAPTSPPALRAWVARTDSMAQTLAACPVDLGQVMTMSRETYRWLISVPPSGTSALDGVAPALIEWQPGGHPAQALPRSGIVLESLELHHPNVDAMNTMLTALGNPEQVSAVATTAGALLRAKLRRGDQAFELSQDVA